MAVTLSQPSLALTRAQGFFVRESVAGACTTGVLILSAAQTKASFLGNVFPRSLKLAAGPASWPWSSIFALAFRVPCLRLYYCLYPWSHFTFFVAYARQARLFSGGFGVSTPKEFVKKGFGTPVL